jgi:hypothetical protein
VVLQIRAAGTRFANRVFGTAELALAMDEGTLLQEAAFVVMVGETTPPNQYHSGVNQRLTERFVVMVALKNDTDKKDKLGFQAFNELHNIRAELFTALLGYPLSSADELIYYAGGSLVDITPAWLWYQFEFEMVTHLATEYDPDAGSLPQLHSIFAQYKLGGDGVLPLPPTESLPTDLLDPDLEEVISLPHGFDEGFDKGFSTLESHEKEDT